MKYTEVSATTDSTIMPKFWLHVYRQPLIRIAIFKLYSLYDMNVCKLSLAKWIDSKTGRIDGDKLTLSWFAKQDCRNYFLSIKDREELARVQIAPDVAIKLGYEKFVKSILGLTDLDIEG